jgi:hypothetical protein
MDATWPKDYPVKITPEKRDAGEHSAMAVE